MEIISEQVEIEELEGFNFIFPAIRGIQAEREYYITMCPLDLIPKIFLFDETPVPPEIRSQRTLSKSRIPKIADYIINNLEDYVFSSITASIDSKVTFKPLGNGKKENMMGFLIVPMDARFIINDGQHRKAAIEKALEQDPELRHETLSVVFFIDAGLKRSQQMFADLNQHPIRPTRSLTILYNHRDPKAIATLEIVKKVPIFKGLTDMEKANIPNRSIKMFTLSSIYQATMTLLGKKQADTSIKKKEKELAIKFWTKIGEVIPEWKMLVEKKVSSSELRKEYVHAHGVILAALGLVGHQLVTNHCNEWEKIVEKLGTIDWSRANAKVWEGRAMIGGRLSKADMNVKLTRNIIKTFLGLELTEDEIEIENKLPIA